MLGLISESICSNKASIHAYSEEKRLEQCANNLYETFDAMRKEKMLNGNSYEIKYRMDGSETVGSLEGVYQKNTTP